MRSHWRVLLKDIKWLKLLERKVTVIIVHRTNLERVRIEAARPIRREKTPPEDFKWGKSRGVKELGERSEVETAGLDDPWVKCKKDRKHNGGVTLLVFRNSWETACYWIILA